MIVFATNKMNHTLARQHLTKYYTAADRVEN